MKGFYGAVHQGVRKLHKGILLSHSITIPNLLFSLSPLIKIMISFISTEFPLFHNYMLNNQPSWKGLAGTYFQSLAVNIDSTTTLHRDPQDSTLAWIYYFGEFEGTFDLPELGFKIKIRPGSFVGVQSRYLYHGGLKCEGQKHFIVFYGHYHKNSTEPSGYDKLLTQLLFDWQW
jgi:hypothetical protein